MECGGVGWGGMVVHKIMDSGNALGLISIRVRNVIRSKKNRLKTIFDQSFTLAQCSGSYNGDFNGQYKISQN